MVLEKTLESPLDCKEIQSVHPKGNQSWIFIGRTDAEAETPTLWTPDVKNWLIWKDPDAGKDWRQEEKGMTEDEMVGWHHRLNEHECEQTLGDGERQGSLACCSPWDHKESDTTEQPNWRKGESAQRIRRGIQGPSYGQPFKIMLKCLLFYPRNNRKTCKVTLLNMYFLKAPSDYSLKHWQEEGKEEADTIIKERKDKELHNDHYTISISEAFKVYSTINKEIIWWRA